ncbi:MAG: nuclear transport factor 2 family protein [Bacteroidia bacterium]|nr:nuclear transport factor 2 family protein [Bacteroidia bacterium]
MEKKKTQKICLIISIIVLLISCTNYNKEIKIDKTDEITLIKEVINGAIGWAKNKDFTVSDRIIANDSNYLEVDPENRIVRGFKEFKKNEAFFADPRFRAVRYEIRDLKIDLSQSGTVAWYYCVLDDINEWDGQPASWMNTRWTGVLEKREGKWVIVQMHFSFAKE